MQDVLQWRAQATPDHPLFLLLNAKVQNSLSLNPGNTVFRVRLCIHCHLTLCAFYFFQGTVANTASCVQLHKRAERVAVALMERGRLNTGDHVALVYPPGKRERDLYYCGLIKMFRSQVLWCSIPLCLPTLQVLIWSPLSMAVCTPAVFQSLSGLHTHKT